MGYGMTTVAGTPGNPSSLRERDSEELAARLTSRLKITSARLQMVVLALVALTPCVVALNVLMGSWADFLDVPADVALDTDRISGIALLALIAVGSIKPAAFMVAFWQLYELLGLYREGIVFTAANVAAIRRIGWALVTIDVAAMVQTAVTGPVLTLFLVSRGHVSLTLEVAFLIVGLFMVLVARVMDLGRELKEHDSLVI